MCGITGFWDLKQRNKKEHIETIIKNMTNVVLTPHIGSATAQTREAMGDLTCDNLLSYFKSGTVFTPVPECSKLNI